MNRLKKVISLGLLLLIAFPFGACRDPNYALDRVDVLILEEYCESIVTKKITAKDFNFENVDYITFSDSGTYAGMFVTVYLKKHGEKYVEKAIEHFNLLEFVESAYPMYTGKLY